MPGIVATTIQSTAALRPIRAADNWLTIVEKLLLTSPRQIAARHRLTAEPPEIADPDA